MKQLLFLFGFLAISGLIQGQANTGNASNTKDKCGLIIQKDEFTGEKKVWSKETNVLSVFPILGSYKPWDLNIGFITLDDSLVLSIVHSSQGFSSSIKEIDFKFADGKVILKKDPRNGFTKKNDFTGYEGTSTFFLLSKDELTQFESVLVQKIRIEFVTTFTNDRLYERELKAKKAQSLLDAATCVLNELK